MPPTQRLHELSRLTCCARHLAAHWLRKQKSPRPDVGFRSDRTPHSLRKRGVQTLLRPHLAVGVPPIGVAFGVVLTGPGAGVVNTTGELGLSTFFVIVDLSVRMPLPSRGAVVCCTLLSCFMTFSGAVAVEPCACAGVLTTPLSTAPFGDAIFGPTCGVFTDVGVLPCAPPAASVGVPGFIGACAVPVNGAVVCAKAPPATRPAIRTVANLAFIGLSFGFMSSELITACQMAKSLWRRLTTAL